MGYLASFFGSLANSAKAWSYESRANARFPFLAQAIPRAARAQNNNPGSLKTFLSRVQRIFDASRPPSALHRRRRRIARCLLTLGSGLIPTGCASLRHGGAWRRPIVSTWRWRWRPASPIALRRRRGRPRWRHVILFVRRRRRDDVHSGMASTSQQARSAFAPRSKSC